MKILKLFSAGAVVLVLSSLASCSSCDSKAKTSGVDAAADEAAELGVAYAKELTSVAPTDTMQLQRVLLEAAAKRSEYELADNVDAAEVFNEAFRSYVEQHDKQLAKSVF